MVKLTKAQRKQIAKYPIGDKERAMLHEIRAKQKGEIYMKKVSDMDYEELQQLLVDCEDTLKSLNPSGVNYHAAKYACDKLKFDATEALKNKSK